MMGRPSTGSPTSLDAAAPSPPLPVERRSWLSHGLVALAISGLGLAVAGSMSVTTSAQTTTEHTTQGQLPRTSAADPLSVGRVGQLTGSSTEASLSGARQAPPLSGTLAAFAVQGTTTAADLDAGLRQALVTERAAQRSEELLKDAEAALRAARDESSKARESDLQAADRAARENAVTIAQQRSSRAIAARVAAQVAREQAQSAAAAANDAAEPLTQATAPEPQSQPQPEPENIPSGGSASPVPGAVVGAGFGQTGIWSRYHTGLDFRAGHGTPIKAVTAGVVVFSGNTGSWAGNHVAVKHADGKTTMSSHMSSAAVRTGETVRAGQVIGYVGSTGRSFGAHLHFELYPEGVRYGDVYKAINPTPWLRALGVNTR